MVVQSDYSVRSLSLSLRDKEREREKREIELDNLRVHLERADPPFLTRY